MAGCKQSVKCYTKTPSLADSNVFKLQKQGICAYATVYHWFTFFWPPLRELPCSSETSPPLSYTTESWINHRNCARIVERVINANLLLTRFIDRIPSQNSNKHTLGRLHMVGKPAHLPRPPSSSGTSLASVLRLFLLPKSARFAAT